jgi:transposase
VASAAPHRWQSHTADVAWPASEDPPRPARRPVGATRTAPRRDPRNALPALGGDPWHAGEPACDGTGDHTFGLDTQKKTLGAAERDEQQRIAYRERIATRDVHDFVVVDECGANINLTPRYARAPRGQRAYGRVPRNTDKNTTLIAAMSTAGMGAAMLLTGATDTVAFEAYVEQVLAPTLMPGKIVVMDNLSAHKSERVRSMIEARGCERWFLPAYSPDLSPIEEAFSKFKAWLRRAAARTQEALIHAMTTGLDVISPQDALGFFKHCGYQPLTWEGQ